MVKLLGKIGFFFFIAGAFFLTMGCNPDHWRTYNKCNEVPAGDAQACVEPGLSVQTCAYNFRTQKCDVAKAKLSWPERMLAQGNNMILAVLADGTIQQIRADQAGVNIQEHDGKKNFEGVALYDDRAILAETHAAKLSWIGAKSPSAVQAEAFFKDRNYGMFSVGSDHQCAITENEQLVFCLQESPSSSYNFPLGFKARYLSSGAHAVCFVKPDGQLRCFAQEKVAKRILQMPEGKFERVFVSKGKSFLACATRFSDRSPACWAEYDSQDAPVVRKAPKNLAFRHIALTENFAVGLVEKKGTLVWWGDAKKPAAAKVREGVQALGNEEFFSVACGQTFCCAVRKKNQRLTCFGEISPAVQSVDFLTKIWPDSLIGLED